ncbi:MAG TPA: hypothetical protein VNU97_02410 [Rhizomicrobium sp.]|jgi:hypothetical protein|nr:hypothetical protein [Rhizomicrobium sp.]
MSRKPQTKQERLAAALRANLKRRKAAQAAARAYTKATRAAAAQLAPERPNTAQKPD